MGVKTKIEAEKLAKHNICITAKPFGHGCRMLAQTPGVHQVDSLQSFVL